MKTLSTVVILFCLLNARVAYAVIYELPHDGWYQLQDAVTYEEKCSSDTPVCDVAAGEYALINHSVPQSDPAHRTVIQIGNTDTGTVTATTQFRIETTQVDAECTNSYPGRPDETDGLPCVAFCPDSYTVTGGSCRITYDTDVFVEDANGSVSGIRSAKLRIPAIESLQRNGYACEIDTEYNYTPFWGGATINFRNSDASNIFATAHCATIVSQ